MNRDRFLARDRRPATPGALDGLTFAVAGAGRVGSSLARWAVAAGARLVRVAVHRRRDGAEALARDLGGADDAVELIALDELSSAGLGLLLVAVSDPALDAVAQGLARRPQAAVALHTAGARGASALAPLAAAGAPDGGTTVATAVGTVHPLKAFPHVLADPAAAHGVTFAVDGEPPARALAERLARAWGGVPQRVPETQRDLYHLAATLAAGGVVTMLAAAERVARAAGLERPVLDGYLELARGAVAGAGEELAAGGSFAAAITGPAVRGDRGTVQRQLAALATVDRGVAELAAEVARQALAALAAAGSATPGQRDLARFLATWKAADAGPAAGDSTPGVC